MPALEQVDGHEDGEQVHVRRVELEAHAGWAEVVAGGHHPDHEEGHAQRVEEGVGGAGARVVVWHQLVCLCNLASQFHDSRPAAGSGWCLTHPLEFPLQDYVLLDESDHEEEKAKEHVAHIA